MIEEAFYWTFSIFAFAVWYFGYRLLKSMLGMNEEPEQVEQGSEFDVWDYEFERQTGNKIDAAHEETQ